MTELSINRSPPAIYCELARPNVGWRAFLRPADDPGLLVAYKAGFIKEMCYLTAGARKGPVYFEWIVRKEQALHACMHASFLGESTAWISTSSAKLCGLVWGFFGIPLLCGQK